MTDKIFLVTGPHSETAIAPYTASEVEVLSYIEPPLLRY